jgi:hypothetical protein
MNTVDPSVLDWWIAYSRVEPFGRDWEQSAAISHQVALLRYEALQSSERNPDHLELATRFESHMPAGWSDKPARTAKYRTPEQEIEIAKSIANYLG